MPIDISTELRLSYLIAAMSAQAETEDKIQTYRDFFDGEQGLKLTDRQEEYITTSPESMANICKRVVNIPKDRLEITEDGIVPTSQEGTKFAELATEWWTENRLGGKQKELYTAALRDGAAAIIVGWDADKQIPTFTPNLVYDGATGLVRFHYDQDDNLLFASKRWTTWNPIKTGETGKRRMTIYRPDVITRYEADSGYASGWRLLDPIRENNNIPNPQYWTDNGGESGTPLGIPVVPFESPDGSELQDVIVLQEILNHNVTTMDVTIDYNGFPLLYFTGANFPLDSDGNIEFPSFAPGTGINLQGGGSAGRIEAADIQKLFDGGVLSFLRILAFIKGWPIHLINPMATPPSGIALQVMEASLVKQVENKQAVFTASWQDAFNMARKLYELNMNTTVAGEITFRWESAKSNDVLTEMQSKQAEFEAGKYPTITRWRELGKTQKQIDEMLADAALEDQFGITGGGEISQ